MPDGLIGEYTLSGATVNAGLVTRMPFPWAVAISGGNLFVTQAGGLPGTIGEYNATSGATVNAALLSNATNPTSDIAASGSDIFVVHAGAISEYTTSGATVNSSLIPSYRDVIAIAISDRIFLPFRTTAEAPSRSANTPPPGRS